MELFKVIELYSKFQILGDSGSWLPLMQKVSAFIQGQMPEEDEE